MAKKTNLAAKLQQQDEEEQGSVAVKAAPLKAPNKATTREGMVNITGWYTLNVKFELEEIRLKRSRAAARKITVQELLDEMMNDFFKKEGSPELAPNSKG